MKNLFTDSERKEILDELRKCNEDDDTEMAHVRADEILCSIILNKFGIGSNEIIAAYRSIGKWYA